MNVLSYVKNSVRHCVALCCTNCGAKLMTPPQRENHSRKHSRSGLHVAELTSWLVVCMQEALKRQNSVSSQLATLFMVVLFGQICPQLLILLPVWAWTQHLTTGLLERYDDVEDQKKELKRARNKVIDQHLVQQPATVFGVCGRLGQILVATFVFVDLEFDVGPVILYSLLFIAAELGFRYWHNRSESPEVAAAL